MKNLIALFLCTSFLLSLSNLNAQSTELELRYGRQNIDQRTLYPIEQGNTFSSNYLGFLAHQRLVQFDDKLSLWLGLGLGLEQQNYNRQITVDWCRFCAICDCVSLPSTRRVESYRQYLFSSPLSIRYSLNQNWQLALEYRPDWVFGKKEIGGMDASWSGFDLMDHNFRPSISYQLGPCRLGFAANFRTKREFDPFFYEEFLRNGLIEAFAQYNRTKDYRPIRFDFSVIYGL